MDILLPRVLAKIIATSDRSINSAYNYETCQHRKVGSLKSAILNFVQLMHRNWQSTSNKKRKREQNLPLCCRTLGWKSRLLRDFSSFFDVHRSFSAVILDVVVVVVVITAGIIVVVAAGIVAVVRRHVNAIAGERHRWRRIVDVRRSRMDRERRSLRPRSAASDRTPGTDAPLGPR